MENDKILNVDDKVKFHSGNYAGLTGVITETDWNSKHPKAIYGVWHTVKLSNGKIGHIEKSEHYEKIK
jgi:transcription antitermination factor NusG